MFSFKDYIPLLTEEKKPARGILHLPHPSESAFHNRRGAVGSTLSKIQNVINGKAPLTRKIDDRMSFQAIRDEQGRIGVKYKGQGATYNFSPEDIKKQHSEKPYIAGPLLNLHKHIHKILPEGPGEYQGGYLSSLNDRTEEDGKIGHKPNTIRYSVDKNSTEGKKLAKAPISVVVHSRIDASGKASPLEAGALKEHPDVHVMSHVVSDEERKIPAASKRKALEHIAAAKKLAKDQSTNHHEGHEETLLRYANSTVDTGEKPSAKGYTKFLQQYHQKKIDKVKTDKAKAQKTETMRAAINHVNDNLDKFDKTFEIHHHIHQATQAVANTLSKTAHGGYSHHIDGQEAAGEGFVSGGMKFVPRAFTEANRKRSAEFKAAKEQKSVL
jgi:hypothetical protein